ncbi:hypothetical protein [Acinetobacter brisouii]|uniref:hypothetical protein n=1 Tax=Acinetobacter brisouii TaxID=396323 RepID=UPI00125077B8|nr:hypothetical protein [Acinetobacter brisouii]
MSKYAGFSVLVLLFSGLLSGCESKAKRDFNAGCQSGGQDRSTCSCVYDRLEKHYSPEFMEKLGEMTPSTMQLPADFSDAMVSAVQHCQAR